MSNYDPHQWLKIRNTQEIHEDVQKINDPDFLQGLYDEAETLEAAEAIHNQLQTVLNEEENSSEEESDTEQAEEVEWEEGIDKDKLWHALGEYLQEEDTETYGTQITNILFHSFLSAATMGAWMLAIVAYMFYDFKKYVESNDLEVTTEYKVTKKTK